MIKRLWKTILVVVCPGVEWKEGVDVLYFHDQIFFSLYTYSSFFSLLFLFTFMSMTTVHFLCLCFCLVWTDWVSGHLAFDTRLVHTYSFSVSNRGIIATKVIPVSLRWIVKIKLNMRKSTMTKGNQKYAVQDRMQIKAFINGKIGWASSNSP